MSIGLTVDLRDTARPAVGGVRAFLQPATVARIAGGAASGHIRKHLFELNRTRPNRLGGVRTEFFRRAGNATSFTVEGDGVTVSIASVGIAQRYFGGVIKPKSARYLTVPVHPKAHGGRARDMDLQVIFGRGGRPVALATKTTAVKKRRKNAAGKLVTVTETRGFGEVMFLLLEKVTQRPDPTVLPPMDEVGGVVIAAVQAALEQRLRGSS